MDQGRTGGRPLDDMIDADLPLEELARLARVDALLRTVAARDRDAVAATGSRAEPADER